MKGRYSKWIIAAVILLNVAFAFGVMWAMKGGADEPAALITEWFKWTTIELTATAGIKFTKILSESIRRLLEAKKASQGGEDAAE